MRLAFVLQLGGETRPAEKLFEGWVEEVDTCVQRRFHSAEELLTFLGERCEAAGLRSQKPERIGRAPIEKKAARRKGTLK